MRATEFMQGLTEDDKMSRIDLGSALANTPSAWKKFISSLPPQLAREFVDERPRPDQDDIDFLTPLRLISPQPVSVRVADLLQHPENQATIGRSPDDVVAAVNQQWDLKIPSGKKYDPNPERYRAYAQMTSSTASPSVMADGVILFGAGRFVAAALRGDETMRVWSMTRQQDVSEGWRENLAAAGIAGALATGTPAQAQAQPTPSVDPIVATVVIDGEQRRLDLSAKNFGDVRQAERWLAKFMRYRGIRDWQGKIERGQPGSGRYQRITIQGAGGLDEQRRRS